MYVIIFSIDKNYDSFQKLKERCNPIFDELKEKKVFKFNPGKCQKVLKKVVKKGTYYTGLTKPVYPPFFN